MLEPEHMDRGSRNQRLYETLKGMGLYVVPIPDKDDPSQIVEMIVSADLPQSGQKPAETGIHPALQGPQIGNVVGPAKDLGHNVVNFPAVGR